MKKTNLILMILISLSIMSACSVRGDAADLYKQELPLQVEINVPESISTDKAITLQAILMQNGKELEQAEFVHFQIWKQDESERYPMEEATAAGNGVYQMTVQFETEGLYYLEVHAGNKGSLVSPQYQFIVGELSDDETDSLKQSPAPKEEIPGDHH